MSHAVRSPDVELIERIKNLERVVVTLNRLPSGASSIGWNLIPAETPRGVLASGYAQTTTSQTAITADTNLTGMSVTVTVGANRRIKVTCQAVVQRTVADGLALGFIKEDTVGIQVWCDFVPSNTSGFLTTGSAILTPTAGSHTYAMSLGRSTGTGTIGTVSNAQSPVFILVEDIGSV